MSDLHAGAWVALRLSSLRRRWQQAAASLTAGVAVAFFFKGVLDFSVLLIGAAFLNAAAAAWLLFTPKSLEILRDVPELRIDGDGLIWLRNISAASAPVFVSSWLVVLETSQGWWPIWCDALPADAFRRLVVAARWPRRTEPLLKVAPLV